MQIVFGQKYTIPAIVSKTYIYFFLDQLWRLVDSIKLENKHENWKFANKSWMIPDKRGRGYVEDSDTNLVLTINEYNSGSEIFLTVKMITIKLSFSVSS